MQVNFGFQLEDLKLIIPLLGLTFGFIVFWFTQKSAKLKLQFNRQFGDENDSAKFILFSRYFGGFTMGIIPLIIYLFVFPETSLIEIGIGIPENGLKEILLWILAFSALLIPLVANNAKKEKAQIDYPQIKIKVWKLKLIIANLLSWAFYFLGYEILYRSLLFFSFRRGLRTMACNSTQCRFLFTYTYPERNWRNAWCNSNGHCFFVYSLIRPDRLQLHLFSILSSPGLITWRSLNTILI